MDINIYQVDAFSHRAFGGNPAGVVPNARNLTDEIMQNIAKEMNLSETAFVTSMFEDLYTIRFFTPVCEVDLCGHATIATFHTLGSLGYIEPIQNGIKTVYQDTRAGRLSVDIVYRDGVVEKILMEQATPKEMGIIDDIQPLINAMGIDISDVGVLDQTVYPEIISTGLPDIILPIRSKEVLDHLDIDMSALAKVSKDFNVIGIHAFYLPKIDSESVYTRNFAPLVGIDEEAATGTSNGALMYFLKKNGLVLDNDIISYQGESMNRPSVIYCQIDEKDNKRMVKVGGSAKIVINGILSI